MEELNAFYGRLLQVGFVVLRQAIHSHNNHWIEAELELLHNVPSLLNEPNLERHRYFWFTERQLYIGKITSLGIAEPTSRMLTFYKPIWQEMEPVLLGVLEPK